MALAVFVAFAFQGTRGLYDSTEGRYALVALEMQQRGNWIEPTLEGAPHWSKPPPTYWAVAAGVSLLGRNAWGARLYLAVVSVLTVLAVAGIGASLWDRRTGWCAGIAFATAPFAVAGASSVSTDAPLALCETLALLGYARFLRTGRRRWLAAMWIAFGLGFGVKGPVALLPLIAIVVWHRRAPRPSGLVHGPGMLLGAVAGLWWFVLVVFRSPDLLGYFVGTETLARITSDDFNRHGEWYAPLTLYVPALALGAGPWMLWAIPPLRRARLWEPRAIRARLSDAGPGALLLLWIVTSFVILSLSRSRLPLYVLPLMTPVCLLLGRAIAQTPPPWGSLRRIGQVAALLALVAAAGKAVSSLPAPSRNMGRLWSLAEQVGASQPGARLVAVDRARLYGLHFYSGRPLQLHFAALPKEPIDPGQAAQVVARMFGDWPDARRIVFVEPRYDDFSRWCAAVGQQAAGFRSAHEGRWTACSVERPSAELP